jgi:hypothetical protein
VGLEGGDGGVYGTIGAVEPVEEFSYFEGATGIGAGGVAVEGLAGGLCPVTDLPFPVGDFSGSGPPHFMQFCTSD